MDTTSLTKPLKISLEVTGKETWHNSFTVEYEGVTRRVPMLAFQVEQDTPKEIECIVSSSASGTKLRQNLANLAQQFYQVGETYSFRVKNDFRSSGGYYELIDSEGRGFTPYLQDIFMSDLRKGQEIICKVVGFCSQGPKVRFAQSGALSAFSFDKDAISSLLPDTTWDKESFSQLLLSSAMESDFETSSHRWLVSQTDGTDGGDPISLVNDIRDNCRILIEDTPLLDKCGNMEEREVIQKRLTDIIEQAGYYLHALQLLGENDAEKFISDILRKLSTSGFLYHPRKNFCILTFLFMMRPELLEKNLPQLLDVILSKKEEIWKVEPFRSEIAKQLDLYISITDEKIPSMENSEEAVSNIFKALAIQICLCSESDQKSLQTARYKAMLLRYTSMKDVPNPRTLLNISYSYLIGQLSKVTGLSFADISNDIKVSSKLYYGAVQATEFEDITPLMYEGNGARLDISDDGIVISPARDAGELKDILPPDGISIWNDMTVKVGKDYSKPAIKKGVSSNAANKTLWKSVEKYFFESTPKATEKKVQVKKFAPTVGDEVYVYVTRIDDAKKTLYCTIEDDKYEGDGYIRISDIVNYNLPVISDSMFRDNKTGAPYLFKATVAEIGAGLSFRFTMKSLIWSRTDFIKKNVYESTPCLLYLYDSNQRRWHAITENGFSIMLSEKEDFVDEDGFPIILSPGDIVYAENISFKQMMIQGVVDEVADATEPLYIHDCFTFLLEDYAEGKTSKTYNNDDAEIELNDIKLMDTKTVSELISIIDRVATVEVDYEKSYNCLGMAKILCRMVGDSLRADYFQGRMDLIDIVHDFSATDKVDSDRLKEIESARGDLIAANSSLSEAFKNLKAVSFMGHPQHKMELFKMHTEGRTSMLRDLAGLVLTYNGLLEAGMEESAEPVQQKIRESLRLKARVSTRKYYGTLKETESSDVEFKTSLIIPPGTCKADPKTQGTNILMEICAFLNSDKGGTLYLGVDDDGFESGLENDLSNKMFDRSRDKYTNYLGNLINSRLGGEADHLVSMEWDASEDVKKDVLILTINEAMNPISLDGIYYERRGARKCVVSDDYRETFLMYRQESAQKRRTEIGEVSPVPVSVPVKKTAKKSETKPQTSELPSKSQLAPDIFNLSYEPVGHIGISDKTYKVCDEPIWDEKYIDLPVSEDLQRSGWLILTHDNGTVSKVCLADLMDKDKNRDSNFGVGVKNIFVATAMNDDLIVLRYTDSHDKDCIRVSPISMIEAESMTGTGEALFTLEISSVIGCDVVPGEKIPSKLRIFDDPRQPGVPTSCEEGKKIQKKLKEIGIKI